MIVLSAGAFFGPFVDLNLYRLLIALEVQPLIRRWVRDLDLALDRATRTWDLKLAQTKAANSDFWQEILLTQELYSPILDILCKDFALEPQAQWREALRITFLPKVPQRINLFNETIWKEVADAFETGDTGETEIYRAAWQLLFDSWLYIFGYHESPAESIFARLADLTRSLEAPPLRIAHCIRDLAYGDESRTDDLAAMVKSNDSKYRTIFEACLWRRTPEEERKQGLKRMRPSKK